MKRFLKWLGLLSVVLVVTIVAFRLLYPLPPLTLRTASSAINDTLDTPLGRAVRPLSAANPDRSGVFALADGKEAFAARVLLAASAERSIDAQYYIWHTDFSGRILTLALYDAAERGVRVRMLIDDNTTVGEDTFLAALDAHPNIEVRLFNPFMVREPRFVGYLTDFLRLNRRMHNKSFTFDNQATIVGGRNVGDEYFGATEGMQYADLDLLAAGPVASDVSRQFDEYWASESAYPAQMILSPASAGTIPALRAQADLDAATDKGKAYAEAVRTTPLVQEFLAGTLPLEWSPTRLVYDDPAKGLGASDDDVLLLSSLSATIGHPTSILDVVSPYFVPGRDGEPFLSGLSRAGLTVRVLTNSAEANDVPIVHAGYAKYRRALLEAGVGITELASAIDVDSRPKAFLGASSASLHAKTIAIDRAHIFVGSFNFDPRSLYLNCEMGLLVDSPAMAGAVSDVFERDFAVGAYRPTLDPDGHLYWLEDRGGEIVRHDVEPNTTAMQRFFTIVLGWLPIEWLL